MIHFERTHSINAAPEAVWFVLGRYMNIDEFAPLITSTEALTDGEDGVGSIRRNNFENGSYMVEEVTSWNPGSGYSIKATDMPGMPLNEARSDVIISPDREQSKVTWTFDYRVKYGPIGWLLGQTLMKMMMSKVIDGNLKGLERQVLGNRGPRG